MKNIPLFLSKNNYVHISQYNHVLQYLDLSPLSFVWNEGEYDVILTSFFVDKFEERPTPQKTQNKTKHLCKGDAIVQIEIYCKSISLLSPSQSQL